MATDLSGWLKKKQRILPGKKKRYFKLASQVLSSHVSIVRIAFGHGYIWAAACSGDILTCVGLTQSAEASWEHNLLGADVLGIESSQEICVMCPSSIRASKRTIRLLAEDRTDYYVWLEALERAANRRIEDFYGLGPCIGRGAFATVYLAMAKNSLQKYAIKVIEKDADDELGLEHAWRELNVMKSINHESIVRTYDIFDTENRVYLVLEYMAGGTLSDLLKTMRRFTEDQARQILTEILEGVAYLHDNSIVHRDLKLTNILCTSSKTNTPVHVKLADFGLANFVGVRTVSKIALHSQVGSPHYVAPEVLLGDAYGPTVDTWSIGIIMHIMLSCRYPFAGETIQETLEQVSKCRYSLSGDDWCYISDSAKHFLRGLLCLDPQKRLGARDALAHPWITQTQE